MRKVTPLLLSVLMLLLGVYTTAMAQSFDERLAYQKHIKSYEFDKALVALQEVPTKSLSLKEKRLILRLETVVMVDGMKQETQSNILAANETDLDPEIVKAAKRQYRNAQDLFLEGKDEIVELVLINILNIYPGYFKAEMLMEKGLEKRKGDYKVYDVVGKLSSRAANYFYGGSYYLASKDYEVLAIIDNKNPEVFEKMGSNYYMMNQKQEALDAWTQSLFLDPNNKELKSFIENTKRYLAAEASKKAATPKVAKEKVQIDDPQVMGVFKSQTQAFDLMESLKARGLKVLVEEDDKGRWVVTVSREELRRANAKTK
ncbi:MAG: hypothetical protein O3A01_01340 [bacterium]|nr:hypothetical protein [bacterium]